MSLSTPTRSRVSAAAPVDPRLTGHRTAALPAGRVRYELRDGLLVMAFSLVASAVLTACLVLISVVGS